VEIRHDDTIGCHSIERRRLDYRITVETRIAVAEVVGHEQYDVRHVGAGTREWREENQDKPA
jgi:hypothetical protein